MPQPKLISDWETPESRKAARTAERKAAMAKRDKMFGRNESPASFLDDPEVAKIAELQRRISQSINRDIQPGECFTIAGSDQAIVGGPWRERAKLLGIL